jgi:outer membrane PBP1 activator LpoA protein
MRRIAVVLLGLLACAGATAAPPLPSAAGAASTPPAPATSTVESLVSEAEAAMAAGQDGRCETLISRIPGGSLNAERMARVQILRAQIGLKRNLPQAAIHSLPTSSAHVPQLAPRIEQLRADAMFASGDPVGAVQALVLRERYLADAGAIGANRERIWQGLLTTPLPAGSSQAISNLDMPSRTWLELALLMQQGVPQSTLLDWASRNNGHPAAEKARHVQLARPKPAAPVVAGAAGARPGGGLASQPLPALGAQGGYALLVPLSGGFAGSGSALRDGFIDAWYAEKAAKPPVRIYDSGGTSGQALSAYQLALKNGATLVVGPLTKDGLSAIATSGGAAVPVLTLNYLDNGASVPSNFLQFGLAPEDEARAVAQHAVAQKRMSALVLSPDSEWGDRVVAAFTAAYTALGGQVLQSARYEPGTQDFGKPLQALMSLDESTQRHRWLTEALGEQSEFEPRGRTDADLVFAPARSAEARVLLPQLDFFRASQLPIYSVAAAYTGTSRDPDGMTVCDMPWMLATDTGPWADPRKEASAAFVDDLKSQPRLFALGADAFRVAQAWSSGRFAQGQSLGGATGRLRIETGNRIARDMDCALLAGGRLAPASLQAGTATP